jgi:hypothetical protein
MADIALRRGRESKAKGRKREKREKKISKTRNEFH